ncbi:uncharacterized protein LOC111915482 isoform X2 [Lactuca sativa]|uniref:uncharacterized protein LOC111915482 isoform X2 n=1 Tax=Lactuca sativa TaxID=4236 RepID=UPI001C68BB2A|nr:uncharacterized protein LOC111915482 isoform X2 [Lactuca sativa]
MKIPNFSGEEDGYHGRFEDKEVKLFVESFQSDPWYFFLTCDSMLKCITYSWSSYRRFSQLLQIYNAHLNGSSDEQVIIGFIKKCIHSESGIVFRFILKRTLLHL